MTLIKEFLTRLWQDQDGQDMIEYALMAGFVTLGAIAALPQVFYEPLSHVMVTVTAKLMRLVS